MCHVQGVASVWGSAVTACCAWFGSFRFGLLAWSCCVPALRAQFDLSFVAFGALRMIVTGLQTVRFSAQQT